MLKRAFYKLSFLFALYLAFYFLLDPVLRIGAVKAGERAVGAKVEIAGVKTGLFPPRLELKGVAVADASEPMRNLIEFERAAFSLEGRPLLQKKFIVGEASLTGLRFQTERKTSGALAKPPEPEQKPEGPTLTEKVRSQVGDFSLEKVGQAKEGMKEGYEIKKEDLESLKLAETLKDGYTKKIDGWEKRWKEEDFDGRAAQVKEQFDKAQSQSDNLKKVKEYHKALKEAKKLADEAKAFEKAFKDDLAKAQEDLKAVQDARKRDTDLALSRLKLPSLDAESLSRFLLGPEMAAKVQKALDWVQWARAKMPTKKPQPEPPKRGQGLTVSFPTEVSYPDWAVRLLKISGEYPMGEERALAFEGEATGLTSQPALLGKPAEVHLASTKEGGREQSFRLDVVLDHRKEPPVDTVAVAYDGIRAAPREFGSADSVQVKVSAGIGSLTAKIAVTGDALDGRIVFGERAVSLTPVVGAKGGGELVKRVASAAFSGLDRFEATVGVKGTLSKPDFGVSSTLGKAFADGIKKALGSELDARKREIEAKIGAIVGEKTDAVQKAIEQKQGDLLGKLGKNGDAAKDLDKKVQDAIDKAQKSLLDPSKSKDLKKLFKK